MRCARLWFGVFGLGFGVWDISKPLNQRQRPKPLNAKNATVSWHFLLLGYQDSNLDRQNQNL
jgi:hypothetical protein